MNIRTWLGEEILTIAREISQIPVEEMRVELLEDWMIRTDIIAFAADIDLLRVPSHQPLFEEISDFREGLTEALSFFRGLTEDIFGEDKEPGKSCFLERTAEKSFHDLAFQGNILLFYLKGEAGKLERYLDENQREAFGAVCGRLDKAISLARHAKDKKDGEQVGQILREVCAELDGKTEELGDYGGPVGVIAEEIGRMERALNVTWNFYEKG